MHKSHFKSIKISINETTYNNWIKLNNKKKNTQKMLKKNTRHRSCELDLMWQRAWERNQWASATFQHFLTSETSRKNIKSRRPIRFVQVLFSKLSTQTIQFSRWLCLSITCINFNHIYICEYIVKRNITHCTRTEYKHHHCRCTIVFTERVLVNSSFIFIWGEHSERISFNILFLLSEII